MQKAKPTVGEGSRERNVQTPLYIPASSFTSAEEFHARIGLLCYSKTQLEKGQCLTK